MSSSSHEKTDLIKVIFDALPSMVFVVDEDARIHEYNEAAARLFEPLKDSALRRRTGDILHCVHSLESPQGCGLAPACGDCVIRASIRAAFEGTHVVRRRSRIQLSLGGKVADIFALVTASPLTYHDKPLALLVIEDLKDIAELQKLIPICCVCRKIRTEEDSWVALESYFKTTWDADFSHGYCPDCRRTELDKLKILQSKKTA